MQSRLKISFILLFLIPLALAPALSFAAESVAGKTFYTQANIWYEKPGPIDAMNFHIGVIIPIGTKVKMLEVNDASSARNAMDNSIQEAFIRFDDEAGRSYTIVFKQSFIQAVNSTFNPKYPKIGATVRDLFRQYFSEKDPMADGGPFRSLSAEEQQHVIAGEIVAGMSKAAVLMAYGYPPRHKTPLLESDTWVYWDTRRKMRNVAFSGDRVTEPDQERGPTKGRRANTSSIDDCIRACKENTKRTSEQCFDGCNK